MADELYVMTDCETTGPIPGIYSMWALGACLVDEPEVNFLAPWIRPLSSRHEPERLAVSSVTMEELFRKGRPALEVMREFADWAERVAAGRRLVFVAKNAPFDWMFVCWYLHVFARRNPFGHDALDTKAYYMGIMGTDWDGTRASQIDPRFRSDLPHTHSPLEDALEQADSFRKMRAHREGKRLLV